MAEVRIYTHSSVLNLQTIDSRFTGETGAGVAVLSQPYLAREVFTDLTTETTVHSMPATAPEGTGLLVVEQAAGQVVNVEVTPAGGALRTASVDSPLLRVSREILAFGPGWRVCFRLHTAPPEEEA